ncbi:MAG: sigma-70 family RNA polymerase sigma factor, partial [Pirellulales bacterium]|nr:sigma-70 family RNA polymerase sigma factor [Pirellulales bacterium]
VQEAFGRLQTTEPPPENLRAWLYRVARNCALDLLRRRARIEPLENPQWLAADTRSADPASLAQQNEEYAMLMTEMNALPARQREAVRLKFQEGLSYAEIAEITGETKANVGWLLHSAIKSLREKLN